MKILYFAWLRERLGLNEETVDLPVETNTVQDLFNWLQSRDDVFADVFSENEIIQVALDKKHTQDRTASLDNVSEIALFPPMTGG